jgi:hypothetical protein
LQHDSKGKTCKAADPPVRALQSKKIGRSLFLAVQEVAAACDGQGFEPKK